MKKYTFEVTIFEGSDEFWDDITQLGKRSGADLLHKEISQILREHGFYNDEVDTVKLVKYEDV